MKTLREGKGIAPLILNIGTTWRPLYRLGKNPRYPLNNRIRSGPYSPCSDCAPTGQAILAPWCTQYRRINYTTRRIRTVNQRGQRRWVNSVLNNSVKR